MSKQAHTGGGATALGQEVRGRSSKLRLVSLVAEQWRKVMEVGRRPSGEYDGEIKFFLETNKINVWGCSSVGRASVLQAGGREFDPP